MLQSAFAALALEAALWLLVLGTEPALALEWALWLLMLGTEAVLAREAMLPDSDIIIYTVLYYTYVDYNGTLLV